jgi:branched-chain amino acid transport system substrate-binding protein
VQERFLIAAAVLLAGCGRGEAPLAPGAEAPAVTVLVGHAGPLTGSIAHQGKDDENGVALALDQANARKPVIGGKRVVFRMLSEDDQGDPKIGTTVAQKLVDAHVSAVIGHLNSGVTIPASEIYVRAGIPVISGSATDSTLT